MFLILLPRNYYLSRKFYTLRETCRDMTIILIEVHIKRLKYLQVRVKVHLNGFKFKLSIKELKTSI